MKKEVLSASSFYNRKYFFNPKMDDLPGPIKKDVKAITICLAEKTKGIFIIGFYEDGSVYFETSAEETDFNYDEINAILEVEKLKKNDKELINSLNLWYKVFILKKKDVLP